MLYKRVCCGGKNVLSFSSQNVPSSIWNWKHQGKEERKNRSILLLKRNMMWNAAPSNAIFVVKWFFRQDYQMLKILTIGLREKKEMRKKVSVCCVCLCNIKWTREKSMFSKWISKNKSARYWCLWTRFWFDTTTTTTIITQLAYWGDEFELWYTVCLKCSFPSSIGTFLRFKENIYLQTWGMPQHVLYNATIIWSQTTTFQKQYSI